MKKRMHKIIGISLFMAIMLVSAQINAQQVDRPMRDRMDRSDRDQMEMRHQRTHEGPNFQKHRKAVNRHKGMRRGPQARANAHHRMHAKHRRSNSEMNHRQMRPMNKQQSLDQAFKNGAISKKQYKKANRRLMKQRVSH